MYRLSIRALLPISPRITDLNYEPIWLWSMGETRGVQSIEELAAEPPCARLQENFAIRNYCNVEVHQRGAAEPAGLDDVDRAIGSNVIDSGRMPSRQFAT